MVQRDIQLFVVLGTQVTGEEDGSDASVREGRKKEGREKIGERKERDRGRMEDKKRDNKVIRRGSRLTE